MALRIRTKNYGKTKLEKMKRLIPFLLLLLLLVGCSRPKPPSQRNRVQQSNTPTKEVVTQAVEDIKTGTTTRPVDKPVPPAPKASSKKSKSTVHNLKTTISLSKNNRTEKVNITFDIPTKVKVGDIIEIKSDNKQTMKLIVRSVEMKSDDKSIYAKYGVQMQHDHPIDGLFKLTDFYFIVDRKTEDRYVDFLEKKYFENGIPPQYSTSPFLTQKTEAKPNSSIPSHHIVRSGETASSIAKKYGISVSTLRQKNRKFNMNYLTVGQKLKLK